MLQSRKDRVKAYKNGKAHTQKKFVNNQIKVKKRIDMKIANKNAIELEKKPHSNNNEKMEGAIDKEKKIKPTS